MKEILIIVGTFSLAADLIVTGIIGLRKKEIKAHNIAMGILFLPLGLIGSVLSFIYSKIEKRVERGRAAVSASIAAIGFGVFILTVFGFFYMDKYGILPDSVINIAVPFFLLSLVFFIIMAHFIE